MKLFPVSTMERLKKELKREDNFNSRINIADEYLKNKEYEKAIYHYNKVSNNKYNKDKYVISRVLKCYYKLEDYHKIMTICKSINIENFRNATFYYGLALEDMGDIHGAELQLVKSNTRYINYGKRLEISRFFIRNNKQQEASNILETIIQEIENMIPKNKAKLERILTQAKELLSGI